MSWLPSVGLGTWKAPAGVVRRVVEEAIKAGYRHIDCASDYGNETEVGEGIRAAIADGVCTREELHVTSKLFCAYHAREHVEPACRRTLSDLGLDYVDLYLIHFPIPLAFVPFEERYPPGWTRHVGEGAVMEHADVPIRETWEAMEALVDSGLAKRIGVSNFSASLIMDMRKYARIKPAALQIELHPYLQQADLVAYCRSVGMEVTGFSPLGSSSYVSIGMDTGHGTGVLADPVIVGIAAQVGKTPAQVCLRWNVQRGVAVVPKSTRSERLAENLDVNFELSDAQMQDIAKLDRNHRYNDPAEFCKGMGGSWPIFA